MKKIVSTLALAVAFAICTAITGIALAGAGAKEGKTCSYSAAKSACSDKGSATATEVAYSGEEKTCSATCSASDKMDVVKGGEGEKMKAGYALGHKVPDFTLADTTGMKHNLSDFDGKVRVLVFYNQACPYVVECYDRINEFSEKMADKDVVTLAIDAGINNSEDSIAKHAEKLNFPILVDRTSNIARKFNAARTPEVFILDRDGVVVYHGAFDNGKVEDASERRTYAADAVKAVLKGEEPMVSQTKAFGCTIKFNKEYDDV